MATYTSFSNQPKLVCCAGPNVVGPEEHDVRPPGRRGLQAWGAHPLFDGLPGVADRAPDLGERLDGPGQLRLGDLRNPLAVQLLHTLRRSHQILALTVATQP